MDVEELKGLVDELGGVRKASRASGVSPTTLSECMRGDRTITQRTADDIRGAAQQIQGPIPKLEHS